MDDDNRLELVPDKEENIYHELYLKERTNDLMGITNVEVKGFYQNPSTEKAQIIHPSHLRPTEQVDLKDIFSEKIEKARLGYYTDITYLEHEHTLKLSYLLFDGTKLVRYQEIYQLYQVNFACCYSMFNRLDVSNYQNLKYSFQRNQAREIAGPVKDLIRDLLQEHNKAEERRKEHLENIANQVKEYKQMLRFEQGVYEEEEYEEFLKFVKEKKEKELNDKLSGFGAFYALGGCIFAMVSYFMGGLVSLSWIAPLACASVVAGIPISFCFLRNKNKKTLDEYIKRIESNHKDREELSAAQEILSLMKKENMTSKKEEEKSPLVRIRDTLQFLEKNRYDGMDIDKQKLYNLAIEYMNQKTGERNNIPKMSLYDVNTELDLTLTNISTKLEEQRDKDEEQVCFEEITRLSASSSLEVGREFVKR